MLSQLLRHPASTAKACDQIPRVGRWRWFAVLEEAEMGGETRRNRRAKVKDHGSHMQHQSLHELHREVSTEELTLSAHLR